MYIIGRSLWSLWSLRRNKTRCLSALSRNPSLYLFSIWGPPGGQFSISVPLVTEATDSVMPSHLLVTVPRSTYCEYMRRLPVVTATGDVRSFPPCPVFITPSSLLTTLTSSHDPIAHTLKHPALMEEQICCMALTGQLWDSLIWMQSYWPKNMEFHWFLALN